MLANLRSNLGLKIILAALKELKGRLVWVLFSLALLGSAQSIFLLFLGPFLKALLGQALQEPVVLLATVLPQGFATLFPQWAAAKVASQVFVWLVPSGIVVAGLLRNGAVYLYQLNTSAIALYCAKYYRDELFAAILRQPYPRVQEKSAAEWMSYLMNDVLFLQTRFSDILNSFVRDTVVMLSAFLTLLVIHWPTALCLLAASPFVAWGMGRTGKRIAFFAEAFQKELARMVELVLEVRQRFDFMRAQAGEACERERFFACNSGYYRLMRQSIMVRAAFAPLMELLGFTCFALLIFLVGRGFLTQSFDASNFLMFFGALGLMLRPLRQLGEQIAKFQETKGSLRRSMQVLSVAAAEVREASAALVASAEAGQPAAFRTDTESLRLAAIAVSYPAKETAFFAENLLLPAGDCIALVGPSGSGKSTFLKCLAGLVAPARWQSNREWALLSAETSLVSQEPFLFSDTLQENLLYGVEAPESISLEEIWAALEFAGISAEVKKLPGGLQHQVHTLSRNLSGGQIQRLVIARALLRAKPILLLDEATSAIDRTGEALLLQRFFDLCQQSPPQPRSRKRGSETQGQALPQRRYTVLAATHRLHCMHLYSQVWFIEQGRVLLQGTHASLLADARYRNFYAAGTAPLA